jgi:hypothetical protein
MRSAAVNGCARPGATFPRPDKESITATCTRGSGTLPKAVADPFWTVASTTRQCTILIEAARSGEGVHSDSDDKGAIPTSTHPGADYGHECGSEGQARRGAATSPNRLTHTVWRGSCRH